MISVSLGARPLGEEHVATVWVARRVSEKVRPALPEVGGNALHGNALLCHLDVRLENLCKREAAEPLNNVDSPARRAGDGHAVHARCWERPALDALCANDIERQARR